MRQSASVIASSSPGAGSRGCGGLANQPALPSGAAVHPKKQRVPNIIWNSSGGVSSGKSGM